MAGFLKEFLDLPAEYDDVLELEKEINRINELAVEQNSEENIDTIDNFVGNFKTNTIEKKTITNNIDTIDNMISQFNVNQPKSNLENDTKKLIENITHDGGVLNFL